MEFSQGGYNSKPRVNSLTPQIIYPSFEEGLWLPWRILEGRHAFHYDTARIQYLHVSKYSQRCTQFSEKEYFYDNKEKASLQLMYFSWKL